MAGLIIIISVAVGLMFATTQARAIRAIKIRAYKAEDTSHGENMGLVMEANQGGNSESNVSKTENLIDIYNAITLGAKSFLWAEYKICGTFISCAHRKKRKKREEMSNTCLC